MDALSMSKQLHSGDYVAMYERKPMSRIERLVPMMRLRADDHLADFACGNAMLLPLVAESVASYSGIDFSEDFIAAAERRALACPGRHSFHCADIVDFCAARPAAFDVGTALDFSEHIDDASFDAIFGAIRSALRPGGRLYLHTPNLDFFMERLKAAGVLRQFPEHIAVRTAQQHVDLLVACGFDRDAIRVHRIAHYNVLRMLHPLRRLPRIGRWFEARLFIECVR